MQSYLVLPKEIILMFNGSHHSVHREQKLSQRTAKGSDTDKMGLGKADPPV